MAVFSSGGTTSPDIYIGIACVLVTLINNILNAIVFVHNKRKKASLARTLYLILSAADFFTAWIITAPYAANVLQDKVVECRESGESECNDCLLYTSPSPRD